MPKPVGVTMGQAASAAQEEPALEPPALALVPSSPAPTLLSLPPDLLLLVAGHLSLAALSSLGAANAELHARLDAPEFDRLFAPLFFASLPKTKGCDTAELLRIVPLVSSATANAGGVRRACAELRARLCCICRTRAADSGLYFKLTARGVCSSCVDYHPGHTERWRQRQLVREHRARAAHDVRSAALLVEALRHALPEVLTNGQAEKRGEDGSDPQADPRLVLVFDSLRHGASLAALLRAAEAAPGRSTLLLVHEATQAGSDALGEEGVEEGTDNAEASNGELSASARVFGAFVDRPWSERSPTGFFGDSSCFLFSMDACVGGSSKGQPPAKTRKTTGHDRNFVHASGEFGLGFGGIVGHLGLSLASDLSGGSCRPMLTYADSAQELLASSSDFFCDSVQLWAFDVMKDDLDGHGSPGRDRRRRRDVPWETTSSDAGVLEPDENRILLEFLGMDKEASRMQDWARR